MVGKSKIIITILMVVVACKIGAAPLIAKINNATDFGFMIVKHTDTSSCSLNERRMIVDARSSFQHEFLLELGKPSLVLRPVYYLDPIQGKKIWLLDEENKYDDAKVSEAHSLFRKASGRRKYSNNDDWMHNFIGLDIFVTPHEIEIFGYLVNLSRVRIGNHIKQHTQWLSFAKGIFSKLVMELDIKQSNRKGVFAKIKMLHGQGGVCTSGIVERI